MITMKRILLTAMLVAANIGLMNAQTARKQVVEDGGTVLTRQRLWKTLLVLPLRCIVHKI